MALDLVQRYNAPDLAVQVDSGARSILPGTNISFSVDPVTGAITINNTGGAGTVTSVGASGSTGLTIGGTNPVTTSGTITFTLSANLQGWSGISPTTGVGGPYVMKAGDTMTGTLNGTVVSMSGNITAGGTVQANNGIMRAQGFSGAADSGVYYFGDAALDNWIYKQSGSNAFLFRFGSPAVQATLNASGTIVTTTGQMNMASAIGFGSSVAASNTDVTRHIALYGTTYGFGITGNRLNYIIPSTASHRFIVGGVDIASIDNTNGLVTAGVNLQVTNGDIYTYRSGGTTGVIFLNSTATRYLYYDGTKYILNSASVEVGGEVRDIIGNVREIPQVISNASANFALSDAGKHKIKNNSTAYTYTIATNATVAFPIGTAITVANPGNTTNNITIAVAGGVTLYRNGTLGGFTVAPGFMVTLLKIGTDHWMA